MHILHITNSYGGTTVYKNLYTQLDMLGIKQTIYVPLNYKNHNRIGNHLIDFVTPQSQIIYSTILKSWHRFLYMHKIHRIVKDIYTKVDMSTVDIIHTATLCADGAAAYFIHRKDKIPYLTTIRNTDVNDYYKKMFWCRYFFSKILGSADKIIFISPVYKEIFLHEVIPIEFSKKIINKVEIIPNGIEPYFLKHRKFKNKGIGKCVQLIFISSFKKGKGLIETIKAVDLLRKKGYLVNLRAIGKGMPYRGNNKKYVDDVEQLASERPWILLEDYKKPMELCEALSLADIFVMPSSPETFGLVYVEALSQCIPIVYAKGQGFDGFFPEGIVGYPAEAGNVEDIARKIELTIINYHEISDSISQLKLEEMFDWKVIANKYNLIYKYSLR